MHPNSVLGIRSINISTVEKIFSTTDLIINNPQHYSEALSGKIIGLLFHLKNPKYTSLKTYSTNFRIFITRMLYLIL